MFGEKPTEGFQHLIRFKHDLKMRTKIKVALLLYSTKRFFTNIKTSV